MRRSATVLLAFGAAALASEAFADDPQRLTVQATASTTYDSNVAASNAAGAAQRGITPADWIFAPGVTVDFTEPLGAQAVFLKGTAAYDFYARNSVLNSQAIDLRGGFQGRLRDCKATLAGEFSDARTSLQQLLVSVTRNIENVETISLDGGCGGPIGFGPTLSVSQQWSNNSAALLRTSDFRTVTVTTGLAYRRPSLGELALIGSYSQTDFPDRRLLTGPANLQDGYRDYSVGVRLNHQIGARIEGTVRLAYTTLDPYVQGVQGYSGLDAEADVSVRVSGRLTTHFTVQRAPIPTIVSNSTYSLQTSYSGGADYTVGPRLSLKLSGSQTFVRYRGGALVPGVDLQRQDYWTVTGTAHYRLSRRLAVELWTSYQHQTGDVSIYDYDDNRVGLSLSASI